MEPIYLDRKAKRIYNLSTIGLDLGFPFNNCGNFSLLPVDNGYLCCMRIFGYFIDGIGRYLTEPKLMLPNPDFHQFCLLDKDLNFVKRIPNVVSEYWKHPQYSEERPYLEDARLVNWNGKMYLSSTVCYQKNGGWSAVGLEVQELEWAWDSIKAKHFWNTLEHGIGGIQKNWLPIQDKAFQYVMGTYPNGCHVMDIRRGTRQDMGKISRRFLRGNTPLVKIGDSHFAILHEVIPPTPQAPIKTYVNYLMEYGKDLLPVRMSKPFKLTQSPIEFVTTFLELPNGEMLLGVTEMDETPYAMIFNKEDIFNL